MIKAWATEGHSVALPGLGTMRFGLRSKAVEDPENENQGSENSGSSTGSGTGGNTNTGGSTGGNTGGNTGGGDDSPIDDD